MTGILATGCGISGEGSGDQDPVGGWISTDGVSFFELNENHAGTFTLCRRADAEGGDLRYMFEATKWPATIPITWETADPPEAEPDDRVYLFQDWDLYQETGVGFRSANVILEWHGDRLEMGADLVVQYERAEGVSRPC